MILPRRSQQFDAAYRLSLGTVLALLGACGGNVVVGVDQPTTTRSDSGIDASEGSEGGMGGNSAGAGGSSAGAGGGAGAGGSSAGAGGGAGAGGSSAGAGGAAGAGGSSAGAAGSSVGAGGNSAGAAGSYGGAAGRAGSGCTGPGCGGAAGHAGGCTGASCAGAGGHAGSGCTGGSCPPPDFCDAGTDPSKVFVSTDPSVCSTIRYSCPSAAFSDACGCGCICDYGDPKRLYIGRPGQCGNTFGCDAPWYRFFDTCGCGCEKRPCNPPAGMVCCSDGVIVTGNCPDPEDSGVGQYRCPDGFPLRPILECSNPGDAEVKASR
jgi:hypothetical protein